MSTTSERAGIDAIGRPAGGRLGRSGDLSDRTDRAHPARRIDADDVFAALSVSGSPHDIAQLVQRLQHRLDELERLGSDLAADARALSQAASLGPDRPGTSSSVLSIREAANELGVSVSMLHKLMKDRRLGHLKVGARTLITVEHLSDFRRSVDVSSNSDPRVRSDGEPGAVPQNRPQNLARPTSTCEQDGGLQ